MKLLSRILIVLGLASMLYGGVTCRRYHALEPPPEAIRPGRPADADADATPYVVGESFFYALAGGLFTLLLGFYLHGKAGARPEHP